MRLETKGQGNP